MWARGPIMGLSDRPDETFLVGYTNAFSTTYDLAGIDVRGGDLIVVQFSHTSTGSAPTLTNAADWNDDCLFNGGPTSSTYFTYGMIWRIANGSSDDHAVFSSGGRGVAFVFRSPGLISGVQASYASDFSNQYTTGDPSSQTALASGETAPCVILTSAKKYSASGNFLSTESPSLDAWHNSGDDFGAGYKLYVEGATPANGTYDISDGGTWNHLTTGFLTF